MVSNTCGLVHGETSPSADATLELCTAKRQHIAHRTGPLMEEARSIPYCVQ